MKWFDSGCASVSTLIFGPRPSTAISFFVDLTCCNSLNQRCWPLALDSLTAHDAAAKVWVHVVRDDNCLSAPVEGEIRPNKGSFRVKFDSSIFKLVDGACREGWDWNLVDGVTKDGFIGFDIRLRVKVSPSALPLPGPAAPSYATAPPLCFCPCPCLYECPLPPLETLLPLPVYVPAALTPP